MKKAIITGITGQDGSYLAELLLTKGTLSSRVLARLNGDPRRERLREVYAELCACLAENRPFES
jgi:GDP-D-mannose dehydratase